MNPPAIKTIRRTFQHVSGPAKRALARLSSRAAATWLWLESHIDGWETTAEAVAAGINASLATVYRALADLEAAQFLRREEVEWCLAVPVLTGENPRGEQRRAHPPARSLPEKIQDPTYTEERSNVVATSSAGGVGVSGTDQKRTDDRPEPVKAKPTNAPDHRDRDLVSCADRVVIEKFLRAWAQEFRDGPNGRNLIVLPSAWQQRILWLWQYWTADELREAFIATRDAVPRKPWKYFCACLEKIAAGTWGDGPAAPDTVRYIGGASVDRDQDPDRLAEAELATVDDPPEPDDPDELAYRRGEITLDEWFRRRTARGNS